MFVIWLCLFLILASAQVQGFCGDSIKWSHNFDINDVYGMWYGVGYAQHTPDMTNKPNSVGCVTLFITNITSDTHDDWLDWSIIKRNYSDQSWRSYKSNPWSDTPMSGSWLDVRVKRKVKRDIYNERRLRVLWDEDGQTMEQTYTYTPDSAGLWVTDQRRPFEREMMAKGIDMWYSDDPPRHPQVMKVIKVTPHSMILNHCSETGDSGIFSLILRRSPSKIQRWEWYEIQKQFNNFQLPNMYRYMAICDGCIHKSSIKIVLICLVLKIFMQRLYHKYFG